MSSVLEFQRLFFVSSCVTWPPISQRSRSRSSLFVIYSLNHNCVRRFLACLRERMAEQCELEHPFRGTVEVDESYFGPRRVKGKAGRGASKKTIVFGICKRLGKIYTEVVEDCT